MKEMKDVTLKITSEQAGKLSRFTASGRLSERATERTLSYEQEGDRVTLTWSFDRFLMKREGGVTLTTEFSRTQETLLTLTGAKDSVFVPIRTQKYVYTQKDGEHFCLLRYTVCYPEGEQRFQLKIRIIELSEEK